MTIDIALANIGCPVCHPPYTGKADTYITYQIVGQVGVVYAEGKEKETGVNYSVDIWTGASFVTLMLATKAALEAAGYIVTVEMEYYDNEIKRHQISLSATIPGAVYG